MAASEVSGRLPLVSSSTRALELGVGGRGGEEGGPGGGGGGGAMIMRERSYIRKGPRKCMSNYVHNLLAFIAHARHTCILAFHMHNIYTDLDP